jgi:tRNA threonylcarbamoyladenosine biosynthesis protein TsaB
MTSAILAIDTTGPRLALGLEMSGRVHLSSEDMATGQAERFFPALDALLAEAGLAYSDLGRIAVTTGPGSFTGLRIGLSAARGLGLSLGIPVLGIPTLLAISLSGDGATAVKLDARREEAYFQRFSAPGVPATGPALLPIAAARARIEPGDMVLTTPFADLDLLLGFAAAADPAEWPPHAAYIRDADAKPQDRFRVARVAPGTNP